ncbi:MAG: TonB-dependent receptor [Pseudomonadota bacterium]
MRLGTGLALTLLAASLARPLGAQGSDTTTLEPVTVTATRSEAAAFEVPASIDRVELDQPALGASLAEALQGLPGVLARERGNYAQDTQISLRGFGSRSTFGIRGLRLLLDGIPATQPDGQGQISHFNLASAERVEVLRGPFSALYGNASGGVIQLFTAEAPATPQLQLDAFRGSYGDQRISLVGAGFGSTVAYSDFRTEGARPHSAARRSSFNGKFDFGLGKGGKLTLLLNALDAPEAQDPLGLNRAQFNSNPRQTATVASQFDTRKSTAQNQLGAIYQQDFGSLGALRLLGYRGQREIEQFLATPMAAQMSATASGGVVDLGAAYGGVDARWSRQQETLSWVAGVSLDRLRQHRRGFENFSEGRSGVRGALRRDEINTVQALDQYVQLDWQLSARMALLMGLRHSALRFESRDLYVRNGNGDDSGRVRYEALTPVAGLLFAQTPALHWYAAYGSGFETPTFAELAYRPDGAGGLNFGLDPARTRNGELGLKWRPWPGTRINTALFRADTRDELVTASNSGGRATFTNAAETRRQGVELSLQSALTSQLDLALAYTLLDAAVRETYRSCTGTPCTMAQTEVRRGTPLPGVAQGQWFSRLSYAPQPAWQLAAEFRYLDAVPVNDTASESAPSHGVFDAEAAYRLRRSSAPAARFSLRLENLFDAQYAGSVIVNEANGRHYEPGRGRTVLAGVELTLPP